MKVLCQLFDSDDMQNLTASETCTRALAMELREAFEEKLTQIQLLEYKKDFPEVASKYRVIEDETIPVLVQPTLSAFDRGEKLSQADIVREVFGCARRPQGNIGRL